MVNMDNTMYGEYGLYGQIRAIKGIYDQIRVNVGKNIGK